MENEKIETEVIKVKIANIRYLEVNARFMTHETFQQLVKNVKDDGGLTSTPFAALYKVFKNPIKLPIMKITRKYGKSYQAIIE